MRIEGNGDAKCEEGIVRAAQELLFLYYYSPNTPKVRERKR